MPQKTKTDLKPLLLRTVPFARADDPEDVVWALRVADALVRQGNHGDAYEWLRRAAAAAIGSNITRARVIESHSKRLHEWLREQSSA